MRQNTLPVVLAIGTGSVALGVFLYFKSHYFPQQQPEFQNRIPTLKKLVAEQEEEAARVVANYLPDSKARLDDLNVRLEDILRQLPGVVQVQVDAGTDKPTHRIIHLRDWHFVPGDLYALDLRNGAGRELSDQEIDRLYQEHLLEVEAVQQEQMALLRCLIRHHGLKRIYAEGLTAKDVPNYAEKVGVLRAMEQKQIRQLKQQLFDVRELLQGMEATGRTKIDRYAEAKKVESGITELLDLHKVRLLELGAAGRLLIAGEIEEVLPLDDSDLLDRAKPITPEGKVRIDRDKLEARHDAQVKAVLDGATFGLIVLGGAHDLSDSVRRLGQGECEYIRVTTRRFKQFSE
jgi:hypothetical protein